MTYVSIPCPSPTGHCWLAKGDEKRQSPKTANECTQATVDVVGPHVTSTRQCAYAMKDLTVHDYFELANAGCHCLISLARFTSSLVILHVVRRRQCCPADAHIQQQMHASLCWCYLFFANVTFPKCTFLFWCSLTLVNSNVPQPMYKLHNGCEGALGDVHVIGQHLQNDVRRLWKIMEGHVRCR